MKIFKTVNLEQTIKYLLFYLVHIICRENRFVITYDQPTERDLVPFLTKLLN